MTTTYRPIVTSKFLKERLITYRSGKRRCRIAASLRFLFVVFLLALSSSFASAQVVIKGNVYGGCELGKVKKSTTVTNSGNAKVTIDGGTMEGSVYGGGMGDTLAVDVKAGWVQGNTEVKMSDGIVERSIYGGGMMGSVGYFNDSTKVDYPSLTVYVPKQCDSGTGQAKVVVSGGSVGDKGSYMPFEDHDPDNDDKGWVFCGSQGMADSITYPKVIAMGVVGNTSLEIKENALVTASVYGGCENGLVLNDTYVKIAGGQIGTGYYKENGVHKWDLPYSETLWANAIDSVKTGRPSAVEAIALNFHECHAWPYTAPYYVYDIFSDSASHPNNNPNHLAYHTSSTAATDGHSFFGNVFGGGSGYYPIAPGVWRYTAGQVNGNATIDITGGHILTTVYGGNESTDVKGKVTINMSGGTVGVPRDSASIANHPVTCSMFGGGMGDPRILFNTWTNVNESEVNVTGGVVFGSVFGGGEEGHVLTDVAVNISGENTIIGTHGYSGYEGNVFGAGRGFSGEALTAGTIGGNSNIAISGGKVLGSVFGGGRNASVGTQFTDPLDSGYGQFNEDSGGKTYGHVVINISGGTIGNNHEHPADRHTEGGNVYGGSMGHIKNLDNTTYNPLWPSMARVKSTHVNITGGDVKSIVYGGAEYGSVRDSAVVVINAPDASIYKVFGGGYGTSDITDHENDSSNVAAAKLAGRVQGNTLVKILKGTIQTSVYGGGEFASVGMVNGSTLINGNTNVVIKGGTIGNANMYHDYYATNFSTQTDHMGHVFGGGQGIENDPTEARKLYCNVNNTRVDISGGRIYGSIFGGGADSHVLGNDSVFIHSIDTIGTRGLTSWDGDVFGGGKGFGYLTYTGTGTDRDSTFHVYKTMGRVGGNTYINIDTCRLMGSVFGGGRLSLTGVDADGVASFLNGQVYDSTSHGLATIVVTGKKSGDVYSTNIGTSNAADLLGSDESVGDIFGSGKGDCDYFDDIWAGRTANTSVTVTGSPRIFGGIFGGGEQSGVGYMQSTASDGNDCGQYYANTGATEVTVGRLNEDDTPVIGTDAEFVLTDHPSGWTFYDTINNVVRLKHTCTGNVFGGGQGDANPDKQNWVTMARSRTATVNIHGGKINSCVFGGAEHGTVSGNTIVNVTGGTIGKELQSDSLKLNNSNQWYVSGHSTYHWGSVFGGGYGTKDITPHTNDSSNVVGTSLAGRTYGNTTVNITGGHIYDNVYGGGDLASVGFVKNGALKNGHCEVNVGSKSSNTASTAIIGPMDGTGMNAYVYGGGKGVGNDPQGKYNAYCNANSTEVTVNLAYTDPSAGVNGWQATDGRVYGSLYGGGADSHVLGDAHVHFENGLIGTYTAATSTEPATITPYGGNIFGSGRNFLKTNYAPGRVGGNTCVEMSGGTLLGSVFGGGRYATTGTDVGGQLMQEGTGHGYAKIVIKGGTIGCREIMADYTDRSIGDVFGGGKGSMEGPAGHPAASALLISLVKNTEIIIKDSINGTLVSSPRIYGTVFGGGEMANVGKFTWGTVTDPNTNQPTIGDIALASDGHTKITISGGTIGADVMQMRCDLASTVPNDGNYDLKYNDDVGHVFGGGEGIVGNPASYATINPSSGTAGIHNNKSLLDLMATVNTTEIIINGGWVKGSVYGGSMSGHVLDSTYITINGGQIGAGYYPATGTTQEKDSLYYGANQFLNPVTYFTANSTYTDLAAAVALNKCVSWEYDASTKRSFDPIALKADAANNYANSKPTNGHSWFGSVFGGGSGYYPYIVKNHNSTADSAAVWNPEAGKVYGNSRVEITGGHILSNVYGGCEVSDVGDYVFANNLAQCQNGGKATIIMSGGTVGVPRTLTGIAANPSLGHIYGAGKGDGHLNFNTLTNVDTTSVTVSGNAMVYGMVFGGAEFGHVVRGARVRVMESGSPAQAPVIGTTGFSGYDGLVFGGGKGDAFKYQGDTLANFSCGRVGGNSCVTMSAGRVMGNLYGGGYVGRVGVGVDGSFDAFVNGSYEYDSIGYHGLAKVELSGGYIGDTLINEGIALLLSKEKVGNVYGSGRGDPDEHLEDDLGRVANSIASITGSPRIYGSVFGGGQMANAGHWVNYVVRYAKHTSTSAVDIQGSPTIGTKKEFTNDFARTYYNQAPLTFYDTINGMVMLSHACTGNVYGSGQGDVIVKTTGARKLEGFEQGHSGRVFVNISGSPVIRGSVFGGTDQGAIWGDTKVVISGGTIGTTEIPYDSVKYDEENSTWIVDNSKTYNYGSVYGGSFGRDAYKHLNVQQYHFTPALQQEVVDSINYLCGRVYGNTSVEIKGTAKVRGNVYGGGDLASVGDTLAGGVVKDGNCTVKVSGGTIGPLDMTGLNAYVFGGGNGFAVDSLELRKAFANVDSTFVIVSGGTICGSVFGGGNDSHTLGSTKITVSTGADIGTNGITTWDGNIFGGGRNFVNSNHTNGRVEGNISITMTGGTMKGSIFGGGRLALSGVNENGEFPTTGWNTADHGNVIINVSGSTVIGNGDNNGYTLLTGSNESVGDIFGSGKGDTKNYMDIVAGRVTNSTINITGSPRIYGAVFGGGEMASLGWWTNNGFINGTGKATIKVGDSESDNPTIGTYLELNYGNLTPSQWTVYDSVTHRLVHTCTGNVFGGCQGDISFKDWSTSPNHWYEMGRSDTAIITINGGTILGKVMGGPEQGTMDRGAHVTVNGGTIGSNLGTADNPNYFGGVYGAGYGSDSKGDNYTPISTNGPTADLVAGRVYGNTQVDMLGGTVYGNVFGGASFAYVGDGVNRNKGKTQVNIGEAVPYGSSTDSTSLTNPHISSVGTTILGEVYGANDRSGTPYGSVKVDVYHTKHSPQVLNVIGNNKIGNYYPVPPIWGDTIKTPEQLASVPAADTNFALKAVYGCSNLADYTPVAGNEASVCVHDCYENTIIDVYGGSNAADAHANVNVDILGGRIRRVFGGGNGETTPANIYGRAKTTIFGGLINELYGGSNTNGFIEVTNLDINQTEDCPLVVGSTYGGSNEAPVIGEIVTTVECGAGSYGTFYGGTSLAPIYGNVTTNIKGGTFDYVFGGSQGSDTYSANIMKYPLLDDVLADSTAAAVAAANNQPYNRIYPESVLTFMREHEELGGTGGTVTLNLLGGTINSAAFGGSDKNGKIDSLIMVNVLDLGDDECGLWLDTLYGGCRSTVYAPDTLMGGRYINSPIINVIHGTVHGAVFGGSEGDTATVESHPIVRIGYDAATMSDVVAKLKAVDQTNVPSSFDPTSNTAVAEVKKDVYGGGNNGQIAGNTTVTVYKHNTVIDGNVFGGGSGDDNLAHLDYGLVQGSDTVRILAGWVKNSVYGGGALGSVNGNTHVELTGGTIGVMNIHKVEGEGGTMIDSIIPNLNIPYYDLTGGNVYGGGRGAHPTANHNNYKDYARVKGNTYVYVSDTVKIRDCVYGGGVLASVGGGTAANAGLAKVIVSGGEVGPLSGSGLNAYVYGGGRGEEDDSPGYFANFANVDSTFVVVCDSARIYGSIFGGGSDGHVLYDARVQLKKSLVNNPAHSKIPVIGTNGKTSWDGNIFGGGRNFRYSNLTAGRVGGNIRIDMSDGELKGNVYGGGRMGLTGIEYNELEDRYDTIQGFDHGYITVNICGGVIGSAVDTATIGNVFGGGKGIVEDEEGSPIYEYEHLAKVKSTTVNIFGNAQVYGSVYGGGELSKVCKNTNVRVYGNAIIGSKLTLGGNSSGTRYNGNVFGGGKGYGGTATDLHDPGEVWGNSTVSIEGGQVMENVFGGGELASVGQMTNDLFMGGDVTLNTNSLSKVIVTGGQVGPLDYTGMNGYVYGGGQGVENDADNAYKDFANVNKTLVTIDIPSDADTTKNRVWGSLFGGGSDGHVLGDARVELKSGIIGTNGKTSWDGNIFGGGRNFKHTNLTAGRVGGNTQVEMSGGQIFGNIYGGGRLGLTGVNADGVMQDGDDHGNTRVIVKGGIVGNNTKTGNNPDDPQVIEVFTDFSMGNIYGGGKGTFDSLPAPHTAATALLLGLTKNTEIIIKDSIDNDDHLVTKPHVYGIVLGGGELANVGKYSWTQNGYDVSNIQFVEGTGNTNVKISGGIIGGDRTQMRPDHYGPWLNYNDDLGYVYGGGEGWSDDPENYAQIHADGPSDPTTSLLDLMATVNNTVVEISGSAWVKASVFGGAESGHVRGDTKVTISGGQIGAGYYVINGVVRDSLYADNQFVNPLTTTITSGPTGNSLEGTAHWIYGDTVCNGAGQVIDTLPIYHPFDPELLNQDILPTDGKSWFGNVFGGGSGWFPYVDTVSGVHSYWYGNSGKVWGNTEVNITGGHILNNVYGANESTDVGGKATIKMSGGTVGVPRTAKQYAERPLLGYVYGGGAGDPRPVFDNLTNVASTDVQITSGIIYGSVLGGSDDGHVLGDTKITVSEDEGKTTAVIGCSGKSGYDGNIFGGGRNLFAENKNAGKVGGKTTIDMSDGVAFGNVYGGGRAGSVVKSTHVNISGGQIGTEQIGAAQATIVNGSVYGGGLGFAGGKNNGNAHEFANVDSTYVNISDTAMIFNAVFGGGEDGHVLGSTVVNMTGGTVGQRNTLAELAVDDYEQPKVDHIYTGSLLGGGKGISTVGGVVGAYNDTTGIVFGNTNVTVSGGTVRHAVYGGGGLSHVGTITSKDSNGLPVFKDNTGICTVTVNGTAHIGPEKKDITAPTLDDLAAAKEFYQTESFTSQQYADTLFKYLGGGAGLVFGGGCGLVGEGDSPYPNLTFNNSTVVNISGKAQVVGSVYGGGETGHVKQGTNITVSGGTIGGMPLHGDTISIAPHYTEYEIPDGPYKDVIVRLKSKDAELYEDEFGAGRYVFRGNVYGGGKGTDTVTYPGKVYRYSSTAGRVYGSTNVTVSDSAVIYNRVYGGGSIASVGTYTHFANAADYEAYTDTLTLGDSIQRIHYEPNTGATHVTIKGGTIGSDGFNNGDVVGGGRGMVGNPRSTDTIGNLTDDADQVLRLAYVSNTHVTVKETDPTKKTRVFSNVYGGSINGNVYGDTYVKVEGGTIGDTIPDTEHGGYKVHGAWHSNVYGGGGGTDRYKVPGKPDHLSITSGRVYGNSTVEIEGGRIMHNVYGGGAIASVGTYDLRKGKNPILENTGVATVKITGDNTIIGYNGDENGMVYGSGRGEIDSVHAYIDSLVYVVKTHVTVGKDGDTGPWVKGSVYGSGENGHVFDSAVVNVHSGTIGCKEAEYLAMDNATVAKYFPYRGNVYGGGCGTDEYRDKNGQWRYNPTAGVVTGYTKVTITGGLISHNVYGGGAMGNVGMSHLGVNSGETGHTHVTISGGQVGLEQAVQNRGLALGGGTVFGGSRGAMLDTLNQHPEWKQLANVNQTEVTVKGTAKIMSSVYGGGQMGRVMNNTSVKIQENAEIGAKIDMLPDDPGYTVRDSLALYRGHVFGGGSGNDSVVYYNSNNPPQITNIWRNREAGQVKGNTTIEMSGGKVYGNLYGGCELTDVGTYTYPENGPVCAKGTGVATIKKSGGQVGWERDSLHIITRPYYGYVYGSGKGNGATDYNTWTNVDSTYVEISGGRVYGSVLGGGEEGHVIRHTHVVVKNAETTIGSVGTTLYDGNVFGAGRGWNPVALTAGSIGGNTWVDIENGTIMGSVIGGGNFGSVGIYFVPDSIPNTANPGHNIVHPLYGVMQGSLSGEVDTDHGYTHVNITGGTIGHNTDGSVGGNVYGGGRGKAGAPGSIYQKVGRVKQTLVNISEPSGKQTFIMGSVFGSGEDGHVEKDTYVNVYGGQVGGTTHGVYTPCTDHYHGNVYGGGRGLHTYENDAHQQVHSITAGVVGGNTHVNIYGGHILRDVYGGGNLSSVGTYNIEDPNNLIWISGGTATVNVLGGEIGTADNSIPNYGYYGNVFGSGHGDIGGEYTHLAFVNETHVTVDSLAKIYGSVFGGGEDGHVKTNTLVDIMGGEIGHTGEHELDGNVYGGGRGLLREGGTISPTAGEVFGHTVVNISSSVHNGTTYTPTIYDNVYGGGSRCVVHDYKVVNISAGTIKGSVYGGSRDIPAGRSNKAPRWVNMWGGTIEKNLYGCSHNSIDSAAVVAGEPQWASFINMAGGTVDSVFGAGYGGHVVGSVGILIGENAIVKRELTEIGDADSLIQIPPAGMGHYQKSKLDIKGSVYAGSDYTDVSGSGLPTWGQHTVTGHSDIYIDGEGYDTQSTGANSMNIRGGLFGSGTHNEAGTTSHDILVRKFGQRVYDSKSNEMKSASRSLTTIQRAGTVMLDEVNIGLTGIKDISHATNDTLYGVMKVDDGFYVTNASGIVLGNTGAAAVMDSIKEVKSLHLKSSTATSYQNMDANNGNWEWIGIKGANYNTAKLYYTETASTTPLTYAQENVILFNDTSKLVVRYNDPNNHGTMTYGELKGFFRMKSPLSPYGTKTFAEARPKLTLSNSGQEENKGDGGFLSYEIANNFFNNDSNDGGDAFTETKQYPYYNVLVTSKTETYQYREWLIRTVVGGKWYVDGRAFNKGGIGRDNMENGRGLYPDRPKKSITRYVNSGDPATSYFGVYAGGKTKSGEGVDFDPTNDVIYVVGPVNDSLEWGSLVGSSYNYKLNKYTETVKLYRYPGGHELYNGKKDGGPGYSSSLPNYNEAYAVGPGPNYGALVETYENSENPDGLTMNNVILDGLYGYVGYDGNGNVIDTGFKVSKIEKPLVVTHARSKLTLCDSTNLRRGYNHTNAALWYTNPDYTPYNAEHQVTAYHGAAIFVDSLATVVVKDTVMITENMQYLKIGENAATEVQCNVYLPTFDKYLEISGALNRGSRIGVTSPKRKATPNYELNTLSPVAWANEGIALSVHNQNNIIDDQHWFFGNGNKTTYYDENNSKGSQTLYFGWTWANVVRSKPGVDSYVESGSGKAVTDITVKDKEGFAWLISKSYGMNDEEATDFQNITIHQEGDFDMNAYVWVPLGNEDHPFKGIYDGKGHTISNLKIDYIGWGDYRYNQRNYGMFGKVIGGKIKRTFLVNGYFRPTSTVSTTSPINVGGLVGYLEGEVYDSEAAISFGNNNSGYDYYIGGLVGNLVSGEIHSSMAMPEVTMGSNTTVGGLVGLASGGHLNNSFVDGKLGLKGELTNTNRGGLVGENEGTAVRNCYASFNGTTTDTDFDGLVKVVSGGTIDSCYVMNGYTYDQNNLAHFGGKFSLTASSADIYGYMYKDNTLTMDKGAKVDTVMFRMLNRWVDSTNKVHPHKYARWARPGLSEINFDYPVLLLEDERHQGDFRSVAPYGIDNRALQYGGPVRDDNEIDSAIYRMAANGKALFVYGDVLNAPNETPGADTKISFQEDVAIMDPGTLGTYDNNYVGITFDNSFGHATSTPGVNVGLPGWDHTDLVRDYHMFSSPLSNAPLGFNYVIDGNNTNTVAYTGGDQGNYYNNNWMYHDDEFSWINGGGNNRYWMKGWKNSQSQNENLTVATGEGWVDGYFPSRVANPGSNITGVTFGADCVEGTDEYGRYPYGMDFLTWSEPTYHWINFKRNGPNHWHSDTPHVHLDYMPLGYESSDFPTNQNEDNLIVGRGYMGTIGTETFMQSHGMLTACDTSIILTYSGWHLKGWNLVGNPYHSYIDFNELGNPAGPNKDVLSNDEELGVPFYVVYDADKYTNNDAGTAFRYYPVTSSINGDYADRYLHPHQGFYVRTDTGGKLSIKKNMLKNRYQVNDASHFRDGRPAYPLVNLYLSSDKGCSDVTVIEFERPEWGGAQKMKDLRVGNGLFYGHHDNDNFAALFAQAGVERVPLWFEAKEDDIFTIKWNTANGDFQSMYLIDNITGVQYDMLRNDTYSFEGHKADYWARFYIVFNVTGLEEQNDLGFSVFFDGSQWVVTGEGALDFIDVPGHVLMHTEIHGGQTRLNLPNVAPGVYMMRLTNSQGCKVQKIIIDKNS